MKRASTAMLSFTFLLGWSPSPAQEMIRPGFYEIAGQVTMPHLEENLRYTATRERRCLFGDEPSAIFSVLRYESLSGCKLSDREPRGETIQFVLRCETPHAATGLARLDTHGDHIAGVLEIKMGGKNQRLIQRIEATRQGECDSRS
jgi:hypothetical protein